VVCLPQYEQVFKDKNITGKRLVHLHELALVGDLEITLADHPKRISAEADKVIEFSLVFSELHFRRNFFDQFNKQHKSEKKHAEKILKLKAMSMSADGNLSLHMKHQAVASPRIWSNELEAHALGATVQAHFMLDAEGGVDVGVKALVKPEEQHAGHSFDEVGCLCEHNWICPGCFVWNRAETGYDTLECVWCEGQRPQDYHPPTWKLVGSLGQDMQCPVKLVVQQRKGGMGRGVRIEDTPKPLGLPAPRSAYPKLTMHPPIVSQRGTADGRRLQEEWQTLASGCAIIDEGETETDRFEDDDTDVVDRTGVAEMIFEATDAFEWNPVRRFLNKDGHLAGYVEKTQEEKDQETASVNALGMTAELLRQRRIGVVQSMLQ
jgi:hypothetical protein